MYFAVFGISLFVEVAVANVTENEVATVCFTSEVAIPLIRDSRFLLSLSNVTTASLEQDFVPPTSFITIPTNFSGVFEMCVNFTILDDPLVEADEVIVYDVLPQADLDSVKFPGSLNSIMFVIVDEDGRQESLLI